MRCSSPINTRRQQHQTESNAFTHSLQPTNGNLSPANPELTKSIVAWNILLSLVTEKDPHSFYKCNKPIGIPHSLKVFVHSHRFQANLQMDWTTNSSLDEKFQFYSIKWRRTFGSGNRRRNLTLKTTLGMFSLTIIESKAPNCCCKWLWTKVAKYTYNWTIQFLQTGQIVGIEL